MSMCWDPGSSRSKRRRPTKSAFWVNSSTNKRILHFFSFRKQAVDALSLIYPTYMVAHILRWLHSTLWYSRQQPTLCYRHLASYLLFTVGEVMGNNSHAFAALFKKYQKNFSLSMGQWEGFFTLLVFRNVFHVCFCRFFKTLLQNLPYVYSVIGALECTLTNVY